MKEGASDVRGKHLKFEEVKTSHTLGGAGEDGVSGEESVEETKGSATCVSRITGNTSQGN